MGNISTYGHTGSVLKVKRRRRRHLQVRLEEDWRAGRVRRPLLLRRYDVLGVVAADVDARGSRHQQRRVRRQRVGDVWREYQGVVIGVIHRDKFLFE